MARIDEPAWARVRGGCAPYTGRTIIECPYDAEPECSKWRDGYLDTIKSVSSFHVKLIEARQAERRAMGKVNEQPGRGRSRLAGRGDWRPDELQFMQAQAGALKSWQIGLALGRSGQAVRGRLHRLRRET